MRFSLRTLVALTAFGPPLLAGLWFCMNYLEAIPDSFYPILAVIPVLVLGYWMDRKRWRLSVRDLCVILAVVSVAMGIIVAIIR